ncbi:MAG: hypothetical protein HZB86_01145 [Deltaproteobacteria bacterium]|nr:hypothetical protein [Deltaproteobacteria bacterium]
MLAVLERAAAWMARVKESHPGNQSAAALLAFHNSCSLLGSRWGRSRDRFLERILSGRTREGWTSEYGGPDPGYESLTLDSLTRCFDRGLRGVRDAIRSGLEFLDASVLPDGSSPSSLSWRGTNFIVPYAIERWAEEEPAARRVARRIRLAAFEGRIPTPSTADRRYTAHFFLPSYVDAHFRCSDAVVEPGEDVPKSSHREQGGVRVFSGDAFRVHLQERRGGIAVFSNTLHRTIWIGHTYCLRSRREIFIPYWDGSFLHAAGDAVEGSATFRSLPGGSRHARLVSSCLAGGRLFGAGGWIETRIKSYAFGPGAPGPARLRRRIDILPGTIRILDSLDASRAARGTELYTVPGGGPSNHPSSQMFSELELSLPPILSGDTAAAISDAWRTGGTVNVDLGFETSGQEISYRCLVGNRETSRGKIVARTVR